MSEIDELAKALVEGNHKRALSVIRAVLEESKFKDEWVKLAWRGWLVGLEKFNSLSLIVRLLNGVSPEDVKRYISYFESLSRTVAGNVPSKVGFAKGYLKVWINLLNSYVSFKHDKSS